ncbi:MAG: prepilin-type N-terminal cleavage/methylation domain-containing protein [Acidobacteria bacterium]|nr:prepilin-type N-terminal cleavage/methylation domain-containing protein [Acidobacteriota bacterium]MBI3662574.1 prepilin-type N-terminal cleavage/methylation domain-containing protein [Acidobacteriota bacterium]
MPALTDKTRLQRGFTLVELMFSTAVLLIGAVAVVQLVPAALQSNLRNRYDSTAVVVAKRYLDQIVDQPLSAASFTDADGRTIFLGSVAAPGLAGNPLRVVGVTARVDFTVGAVANYNLTYVDPNDAVGLSYEVRWTVVTSMQGTNVVAKRFLVGVWKRDPRQVTQPVTLDAWVQR